MQMGVGALDRRGRRTATADRAAIVAVEPHARGVRAALGRGRAPGRPCPDRTIRSWPGSTAAPCRSIAWPAVLDRASTSSSPSTTTAAEQAMRDLAVGRHRGGRDRRGRAGRPPGAGRRGPGRRRAGRPAALVVCTEGADRSRRLRAHRRPPTDGPLSRSWYVRRPERALGVPRSETASGGGGRLASASSRRRMRGSAMRSAASKYAVRTTAGPRSSAIAFSPIARSAGLRGSNRTTWTPALRSRRTSCSRRRWMVQRTPRSGVVLRPCAADIGAMTIATSMPSPRSTSAFVDSAPLHRGTPAARCAPGRSSRGSRTMRRPPATAGPRGPAARRTPPGDRRSAAPRRSTDRRATPRRATRPRSSACDETSQVPAGSRVDATTDGRMAHGFRAMRRRSATAGEAPAGEETGQVEGWEVGRLGGEGLDQRRTLGRRPRPRSPTPPGRSQPGPCGGRSR